MATNKTLLEAALASWPLDRWPAPDTLWFKNELEIAIVAPWHSISVRLSKPTTREAVLKVQQKLRREGKLVTPLLKPEKPE